jgi:hypothetical protein
MKITATIDSGIETRLLRDQADLDRFVAEIWDRAPREKLLDERPERFPCVMLVREPALNNPNDANTLVNTFLYDFVIHEGVEELQNHWRLEDEGYFPSTEDAA